MEATLSFLSKHDILYSPWNDQIFSNGNKSILHLAFASSGPFGEHPIDWIFYASFSLIWIDNWIESSNKRLQIHFSFNHCLDVYLGLNCWLIEALLRRSMISGILLCWSNHWLLFPGEVHFWFVNFTRFDDARNRIIKSISITFSEKETSLGQAFLPYVHSTVKFSARNWKSNQTNSLS